ncbi:MAG: thioredoxin domain-containing protein [Chloroflexi bacterium]|nr:thioredoxin domain-containing protein [Chloroflexota bacterium]
MTAKAKTSRLNNRMIIALVIAAAGIVALAFVILSSQGGSSSDGSAYAGIPQARQDDGGFVLGSADAPITIVAFEDFLCSHCQRFKPTVDEFIAKFVATGMARFEYRLFPAVHPAYSPLAGKLAECADTLRPGSFWHAHDVLFDVASARAFSDQSSRTFADSMDLSYADLLECTADASQVDIDTQLGTQLGVTGTPTIMVRYGNSMPQHNPFGRQANLEQLSMLVEQANP